MPESPRGSGTISVAYVIHNLNYGGMERVLHSLARELPSRGVEVHIVVLEYLGRFAEGLGEEVHFHHVPPMSRRSFLHPRALVDVIRRIAPDIVHSHTGVWLKAARAARLAGVPAVVHTEHGRPDPVPLADRLIDNLASRWTDVVVAVSDSMDRLLRSQVVHDPARLRVITNGIDIPPLRRLDDRLAIREALGIPADALVIGSVGRLEPVKNYQLAVKAFAMLIPRLLGGPPPLLVAAGDGSERPALEHLARQLGVEDRVRFLGWRDDVARLYGAFDVFTLTSRSEGTSISLLEAMSTGVCPLVTDVGGNRAVLGASLQAHLVPDNDVPALAAAWEALFQDPARRTEAGTMARQRVTESFSLERMVAAHEALYRELAALHPRAPDIGRSGTGTVA